MCLFRFVISHAATITANNLMRHCKKHLPTQNNKLWILGVISKFSFSIFLAYSPLLTQTCTQTLTVRCSKNDLDAFLTFLLLFRNNKCSCLFHFVKYCYYTQKYHAYFVWSDSLHSTLHVTGLPAHCIRTWDRHF